MDNGCLCNFCSNKRIELINKLKRGENISNEKIIHNLDLIINAIKNNINKKQTYNNQIIKKTLNNIIFEKKV